MNNRKPLITTFILIALMFVLIFMQDLFNDNFKEVAFVDNNVGYLKTYSYEDEGISFSLPENWETKVLNSNDYNVFKIEFNDKGNNIIGYIDFIDSKEDTTVLAQKDMDNMMLSHSEEKIETYKSNNRNSIKVEYTTKVNKGYKYNNTNYYIPLNNSLVAKCTFITKDDNYKESMKLVYNAVVDSVR